MNALEKLRQVAEEIRANTDPLKLQGNWELAQRLISRFPVDQKAAAEAVRVKDFAKLDVLIASLEAPKAKAAPTETGPVEVTPEMREAMKAFRKRLKLTRLDDESRLGNRQMTGGHASEIDAIIPPSEFGAGVWKSLARAGVLRDMGQGFYMLVEGASLD